jgi:phosphoglycolate phosphatase
MARPIIVFDLDGTLVETAPDLLDSLNHCLRTLSLNEVDPGEIRRYVGFGGRVMIERACVAHGRRLNQEELDTVYEVFLQHYESNMPGRSEAFPGVIDSIKAFHEAGYLTAVCTNKLEGLSRRLLDRMGIAHLFTAICGADTFEQRKPDPRHLLATIEMAGGDPERCVMVGDSRTDIDTAKNAGIPVVAVDFGYTDQPVHVFEPSKVISHFSELTVELAERLIQSASSEQPA